MKDTATKMALDNKERIMENQTDEVIAKETEKHRFFSWDWKQQAPLNDIWVAMRELALGSSLGSVDLREVPDTHADFYAFVLANHPLDDAQAQAIFDNDYWDEVADWDEDDDLDQGLVDLDTGPPSSAPSRFPSI